MSDARIERYDFFLSRRGSVAAIALEVADVLTGQGYRVQVQDYDFVSATTSSKQCMRALWENAAIAVTPWSPNADRTVCGVGRI